MIDEIELREGWWWPKTDQRCWDYMQTHPDVPEKIVEYLPQECRRVIVQAGGNCGYYPKKYSQLFDRVYTFEPDWLNFHCLNLNVPESNVVKIQSCLGNEHQTVGLNIKSINRGKNFINGPGVYPVLRIDDLALDQCSAIQLDVEGYEYYALLGAEKTIKQHHPVIVVEVWDQLTNRFDKNVNQKLDDFLQSLGYKLTTTLYDSDRIYQYQS
jgi:FkbM family methyltransferase